MENEKPKKSFLDEYLTTIILLVSVGIASLGLIDGINGAITTTIAAVVYVAGVVVLITKVAKKEEEISVHRVFNWFMIGFYLVIMWILSNKF